MMFALMLHKDDRTYKMLVFPGTEAGGDAARQELAEHRARLVPGYSWWYSVNEIEDETVICQEDTHMGRTLCGRREWTYEEVTTIRAKATCPACDAAHTV